MKIVYHIFTHNHDDYAKDLDKAKEIYQSFVDEHDCARLYREEHDEDGDVMNEDCLLSHGEYPQ